MWRWVVVVVALAALLLSGCAQAAQKAVEQTTGVKTDQSGENVTISSKDGTAVTISSKTPDELKDFPVPDGFKLESSGTMSSGSDDKLIVASWIGKSDYKAVSEFYKTAMADKGWKNDFSMDTDSGGMQNWSKTDYGVTITYDKPKDKDEANISILMGKGKKTPTPTEPEPTDTPEPEEATPTPSEPEATDTPEPPKTGDPSALAPELKNIPVPDGFALAADGMMRFEEGGKLKGATAMWFGKASVKDAGDFYKKSMSGKGWTEQELIQMDDMVVASYVSDKDDTLKLTISVSKDDKGTNLVMMLQKEE